MVSPVLQEGWYDGGFLISEANGHLSRDAGLIANATTSDIQYSAGLVVVQNTTGAATAAAIQGNTGNGTCGPITVLNGSQFGAYAIVFETPTEFSVTDPAGNEVGTGNVGQQFSDEIQFTLTAGTTAFVENDGFSVIVTEPDNAWQSWQGGTIPTNSANQPLIGVLYNRIFAAAGEASEVAIIRRNAEVQLGSLQWDPAVTGAATSAAFQATALAALAQLNIIAR